MCCLHLQAREIFKRRHLHSVYRYIPPPDNSVYGSVVIFDEIVEK